MSLQTLAGHTSELIRRRFLPVSEPEHLDHEGMLDRMGELDQLYPHVGWEEAARQLDLLVRHDRSVRAASTETRRRLWESFETAKEGLR